MGRHQVRVESGLGKRPELLIKDAGIERMVDGREVNDPRRGNVLLYRFAFQSRNDFF